MKILLGWFNLNSLQAKLKAGKFNLQFFGNPYGQNIV